MARAFIQGVKRKYANKYVRRGEIYYRDVELGRLRS
jgi:hypothetical protein